jgi:hypothetical protein
MAEPVRKTSRTRTGKNALNANPVTRPGAPLEAVSPPDPGAHWIEPEPQSRHGQRFMRRGLKDMTPVFGSSSPPRGASGAPRGLAYRVPEDEAKHWLMLMAADRVDVLETKLGGWLGAPIDALGFPELGQRVRRNPWPVVLTGAALFVLWRAFRPSSEVEYEEVDYEAED